MNGIKRFLGAYNNIVLGQNIKETWKIQAKRASSQTLMAHFPSDHKHIRQSMYTRSVRTGAYKSSSPFLTVWGLGPGLRRTEVPFHFTNRGDFIPREFLVVAANTPPSYLGQQPRRDPPTGTIGGAAPQFAVPYVVLLGTYVWVINYRPSRDETHPSPYRALGPFLPRSRGWGSPSGAEDGGGVGDQHTVQIPDPTHPPLSSFARG